MASEQGAWLSTLPDVLLWMLQAQAEVCYPKYIPAGEELSPLAKNVCVCVAATWPAAVTAICLSCLPITSSPSSTQDYGTRAAVAVRVVVLVG